MDTRCGRPDGDSGGSRNSRSSFRLIQDTALIRLAGGGALDKLEKKGYADNVNDTHHRGRTLHAREEGVCTQPRIVPSTRKKRLTSGNRIPRTGPDCDSGISIPTAASVRPILKGPWVTVRSTRPTASVTVTSCRHGEAATSTEESEALSL